MQKTRKRPKILDLREGNGLRPYALFEVFSIMLFPDDARKRQSFMARIRSCPSEDRNVILGNALQDICFDGLFAGQAVVALLQDRAHPCPDGPLSLQEALQIAAAAIRWNSGFSPDGSAVPLRFRKSELPPRDTRPGSRGFHRDTLRKTFHEFRPVGHLWSALLGLACMADGALRQGQPFMRTPQELCRMINMANKIAEEAATLRVRGLSPPVLLPKGTTWRVSLPAALIEGGEFVYAEISQKLRPIVSEG